MNEQRAGRGIAGGLWGSGAMTPLLGHFMLVATSANVREHAAHPLDYWGQGVVGFESRRPGESGQVTGSFLKFRKPPVDRLTVI